MSGLRACMAAFTTYGAIFDKTKASVFIALRFLLFIFFAYFYVSVILPIVLFIDFITSEI